MLVKRSGLVFLLILWLCYNGQLIVHLPSPMVAPDNHLFKVLLNQNLRISLASSISYLSAEPANAFLLAKLKCRLQGRYMWLRFLLSTLVWCKC